MIGHIHERTPKHELPDDHPNACAHLGAVKEMLLSRQDLIRHFFSVPTFTKKEAGMMFKFYWTRLPLLHPPQCGQDESAGRIRCVKKRGRVALSEGELEGLAECANGFGIFSSEVSGEEMRKLFFCEGAELQLSPLVAQQAYGVFVSAVQSQGRLCSNWQKAMACLNRVRKASGKFFTEKDYNTMKQRQGWSGKYDRIKEAVEGILS